MRKCHYPACVHNSKNSSSHGCKMHKFPHDHYKCRMWMRASSIAGTPRRLPASIFICSCHFVDKMGPTEDHPTPVVYIPPRASLKSPFLMKVLDFSPALVRTRRTSHQDSIPEHLNMSNPDDPEVLVNSFKENASSVSDVAVNNTNVIVGHSSDDIGTPIADSAVEGNRSVDFGTPVTPHMPRPPPQAGRVQMTPEAVQVARATNSFDSDFGLLSSSTPIQGKEDGDMYNLKMKRRSEKGNEDEVDLKRCEVEDNALDMKVPQRLCFQRDFQMQHDAPLVSYERSHKWPDSEFKYFTGISKKTFVVLFNLFEGEGIDQLKYRLNRSTPKKMGFPLHTERGNLFMTLVRLRRGYSLQDMNMMFGLPESVISDIFTTWIRLLALKFKSMEDSIFISAAAQKDNQPDCYEPFDNLRCVIDATDIKIQKPKNMAQQCNTFSTYKSANVVKFLVATSVYGGLSFISEGMEGNISDRQLFLKSKIMNHLQSGDAIMADRGFDIEADLNDINVELLIPPFLGNREAFTPREVLLAKAIASSRIHVETFIGRIKFWKLIRNVVPNTLLDVLSDIVRVCANLVNFDAPFIQWQTAHKHKEKKSTN